MQEASCSWAFDMFELAQATSNQPLSALGFFLIKASVILALGLASDLGHKSTHIGTDVLELLEGSQSVQDALGHHLLLPEPVFAGASASVDWIKRSPSAAE